MWCFSVVLVCGGVVFRIVSILVCVVSFQCHFFGCSASTGACEGGDVAVYGRKPTANMCAVLRAKKAKSHRKMHTALRDADGGRQGKHRNMFAHSATRLD